MGSCVVVELQRNALKWSKVIDEIVRIERKIFPKHESLARSFDEELNKRNNGLLYSDVDGDVAGYVMYSWPSSLCASITKLAAVLFLSCKCYGRKWSYSSCCTLWTSKPIGSYIKVIHIRVYIQFRPVLACLLKPCCLPHQPLLSFLLQLYGIKS